jgi:hypothetical protein
VRCAEHGGPALSIRQCRLIGVEPPASDHHGLLVELAHRAERRLAEVPG